MTTAMRVDTQLHIWAETLGVTQKLEGGFLPKKSPVPLLSSLPLSHTGLSPKGLSIEELPLGSGENGFLNGKHACKDS